MELKKVLVPRAISEEVGRFDLQRSILIKLLTWIHSDIPFGNRDSRLQNDERLFSLRVMFHEAQSIHVFRDAVDDSTSPDHLIVADIKHLKRTNS